MKENKDIEFEKKIKENLKEIKSLEELNEAQIYLRKALLNIFSEGDEEEYKKRDKEYDIEKTKKLFYLYLKPIK